MAQHDYDTNLKAKEEIELLISINREQLAILQELKTVTAFEGLDIGGRART